MSGDDDMLAFRCVISAPKFAPSAYHNGHFPLLYRLASCHLRLALSLACFAPFDDYLQSGLSILISPYLLATFCDVDISASLAQPPRAKNAPFTAEITTTIADCRRFPRRAFHWRLRPGVRHFLCHLRLAAASSIAAAAASRY